MLLGCGWMCLFGLVWFGGLFGVGVLFVGVWDGCVDLWVVVWWFVVVLSFGVVLGGLIWVVILRLWGLGGVL